MSLSIAALELIKMPERNRVIRIHCFQSFSGIAVAPLRKLSSSEINQQLEIAVSEARIKRLSSEDYPLHNLPPSPLPFSLSRWFRSLAAAASASLYALRRT